MSSVRSRSSGCRLLNQGFGLASHCARVSPSGSCANAGPALETAAPKAPALTALPAFAIRISTGPRAATVTLKLKTADFRLRTRAQSFERPTQPSTS